MNTALLSCALAVSVGCSVAAPALASVTITQWNFQNFAIGVNNTPVPSVGTGSATQLGMTNTLNGVQSVANSDIFGGNNANGSTDPLQGGSPTIARAWRVRGGAAPGGPSANGWSSNAPLHSQGAQFNASSVGFSGISFSFDLYVTDRGPRDWQVQYTLDGSSWTNVGPAGTAGLGGDRWYNNNVVDLSGIAAANDNANLGFRVVSTYGAGTTQYFAADNGPMSNTSGNWRFDMVTFTAVPSPAGVAALGLAGVFASRRRRA
jgi:MYXO-CTERM domain-containing protein